MSSKTMKNYKKGEVIFKEGDFELCMYDIYSGKVGIYANYGTPAQKLLTTLAAEDFFGEMGLIDAFPRSATAVALEDAQVAVIDDDNFNTYFKERPAKIVLIMQHMSARMRELTKDYMEACGTIAEYLEAEEQNQPKSESLLGRMKKFVDVYRKNKR